MMCDTCAQLRFDVERLLEEEINTDNLDEMINWIDRYVEAYDERRQHVLECEEVE